MLRVVAVLLALVPTAAVAIETMRIQMADVSSEVAVQGEVLGYGQDADEAPYTPLRERTAQVRVVGGRLELNGIPWVGEAIRFRAGAEFLDAGVPGREGIRAAQLEVRGDVVVRLSRGALQLINVVPLEDYLAAVLGSEMPPSFPPEALKAQAVAARTYALQKKLDAYDAPFHLGSSVLHQVYGGLAREDARTRAAVEATRGEVLTHDLAPIEAYFHASCGGRTESGLEALGRDRPYLPSVDCPCGKLPASRWELTLHSSEFKKLVGSNNPRELRVLSKSGTGRAQRVSLGGGRSLDGASFRRRLGYTRLKSLWFEVKSARKDTLLLTGRGYGHGAGLCQWGAKASADGGWDYRRILGHYYPGAELQRLY